MKDKKRLIYSILATFTGGFCVYLLFAYKSEISYSLLLTEGWVFSVIFYGIIFAVGVVFLTSWIFDDLKKAL